MEWTHGVFNDEVLLNKRAMGSFEELTHYYNAHGGHG